MFLNCFQPNIISLFSSTGNYPLQLFSKHVDKALQSDSFIHFLDDSTSLPKPPSPATLIALPPIGQNDADADSNSLGYQLCQTVLHIQSPTLRTTYIQCPPLSRSQFALKAKRAITSGLRTGSASAPARSFHPSSPSSSIMSARMDDDLGIKHPWLHIQVRSLGREWSFEAGVVDQSGRRGIIRWSTFQHGISVRKEPTLKALPAPLLHLPLSFPSASSRPLTAWCSISVNLATLISHFQSLASSDKDDDSDAASGHGIPPTLLPGGRFSHVSFIKIYSNCRLRRIWFTESRTNTEQLPWEFQLYSSD